MPEYLNQVFEICSNVHDDINSIYKVIIKQTSKEEFNQFCENYNKNQANANKIDFLDQKYIQLYILINKHQIQIDNIENFRSSINQIFSSSHSCYFEDQLKTLLATYQSIAQETKKNIAVNILLSYFVNNISLLTQNHNNPDIYLQHLCNILMAICNNDNLCETIDQKSRTETPEILHNYLFILLTQDHALENALYSFDIAP